MREAWYFAVLSDKVKRGGLFAKAIYDQPILFGRDREGKSFALLDICPHRGIPLRFGTFDGQEVQCAYHGWRFGPTGACTAIPPVMPDQQPDLTKFGVRAYPVQEKFGGIWVYLGKQPQTAPSLPDLPMVERMAPKLSLSMVFKSPIDHTVIGLMDPAHGTYVHRSWFWRTKALDKEKRFVPSPWGFTMARHAPSANARAYSALGSGTRTTEISFRLPGIRVEIVEVGRHFLCSLTALTPLGPNETEINQLGFWSIPWLSALKPVLRQFAVTFLNQDRLVVEQQQEGLRYQPQLLLLGDPDAQARWYFRLKNEYRRSLAEGREFVNPVKERILRWRS